MISTIVAHALPFILWPVVHPNPFYLQPLARRPLMEVQCELSSLPPLIRALTSLFYSGSRKWQLGITVYPLVNPAMCLSGEFPFVHIRETSVLTLCREKINSSRCGMSIMVDIVYWLAKRNSGPVTSKRIIHLQSGRRSGRARTSYLAVIPHRIYHQACWCLGVEVGGLLGQSLAIVGCLKHRGDAGRVEEESHLICS